MFESSVCGQFFTRRLCPAGRLPAIDHFQGHPRVRRMSGEPTFPAGHGPEGLLFKLHGFDQHGSFIVLHREGIFNIHGFPDRNVRYFSILHLRIVPHPKHNVRHFLPNVQEWILFVQHLEEFVQHSVRLSRLTVQHYNRIVQHLRKNVQHRMGLSNIFKKMSII